jgi:hypothetical protein
MTDMRLVDGHADAVADRAADGTPGARPGAGKLFRDEALSEYQKGSTIEGHLLELEPAWLRRAYALILALLGVALLASVLVRLDREVEGVGVIRGGRLLAVVPARDRAELRRGLPLRFELAGEPMAIDTVDGTIVAPSEARRLLGPDGALLWTSREPAVRIEAPLPAKDGHLGDGLAGTVRVRLGRERLLFVLLPALGRWHV